jgi:hypothetical protein
MSSVYVHLTPLSLWIAPWRFKQAPLTADWHQIITLINRGERMTSHPSFAVQHHHRIFRTCAASRDVLPSMMMKTSKLPHSPSGSYPRGLRYRNIEVVLMPCSVLESLQGFHPPYQRNWLPELQPSTIMMSDDLALAVDEHIRICSHRLYYIWSIIC